MKSAIFCITLLFAALPVQAETPPSGPGAGPYAAQRQQLMERRKTMESESHQARIGILESADACIKSAKTPAQYRACEQTERQSREQLRQSQQPEHQALRQDGQQLREEATQHRQDMAKQREERRAQREERRQSRPQPPQ